MYSKKKKKNSFSLNENLNNNEWKNSKIKKDTSFMSVRPMQRQLHYVSQFSTKTGSLPCVKKKQKKLPSNLDKLRRSLLFASFLPDVVKDSKKKKKRTFSKLAECYSPWEKKIKCYLLVQLECHIHTECLLHPPRDRKNTIFKISVMM